MKLLKASASAALRLWRGFIVPTDQPCNGGAKNASCPAIVHTGEAITIATETGGRSMKPKPYTVTEIKDFALSADGTQATFTLVTKDAGDMVMAMPASYLEALKPPQDRAPAGVKAKSGETRKGTLHRPKKWLLGGETTKHKIVALIFDPQSDRETALPSARSRRRTWRPVLLRAPTALRATSRPS